MLHHNNNYQDTEATKIFYTVNSAYTDYLKFVSDLGQVGGFLPVLQFPPPIKLTMTKNVESDVKHRNPNPSHPPPPPF